MFTDSIRSDAEGSSNFSGRYAFSNQCQNLFLALCQRFRDSIVFLNRLGNLRSNKQATVANMPNCRCEGIGHGIFEQETSSTIVNEARTEIRIRVRREHQRAN